MPHLERLVTWAAVGLLAALATLGPPPPAEGAEVADFGVVVTADPTPVAAGADLTYTIEVSTEGPSDAQDVTVADPLPSGTTFRSLVAPAGWTCLTPQVGATGAVTCTRPTFAPGTAFFTLVVATDPGLTDPLVNTATVTTSTPDPNPGNESGTATTAVFVLADLGVTAVAAPDPGTAGADLTYAITLANAGPSAARNVTLTAPLPPGTTFQDLAAAAGWACVTPAVGAPGAATCTRAVLLPGDEAFTLRVRVDPGIDAPLSTTVTVTATSPDPVAANDAAALVTAVVARSDLAVQLVSDPDPALAGDRLRYEVLVSAGGPSVARDARVTLPLPEGVTLEALAAPAGWSCTAPAPGEPGLVDCTTVLLEPGTATLAVEVQVDPAAGPTLAATATVGAVTLDPLPANDTATLTIAVEPPARRVAVAAGGEAPPLIRVFDVNTLTEVETFLAGPAEFTGGVRIASGDVNGDGVPDVVAGAGPGGGGRVRVFDGLTAAVLLDLQPFGTPFAGGVFVAAGDLDGDSRADLVVGADAGGPPLVHVLSGATGAALWTLEAFPAGFAGGVRVAVGDVDGDGVPDVVAGTGPGGPAEVRALDVGSGAVLLSLSPYGPAFTGGVFVAAGDLDGDGRAEVLVGPDAGAPAVVRILDGATGTEVLAFSTFAPPFTGGVRVALGDVNRDGVPDVIAGTGPGTPADVWVHDGRTGARLGTFQPFPPGSLGGVFVAAAPAARSHAAVRFLAPPSGTAVQPGELLALSWTALPGAAGYAVDIEGPGLGDAGVSVEVVGTELAAVVPFGTAPGDYQLRVTGRGPGGQRLGRPSAPLTIVVE